MNKVLETIHSLRTIHGNFSEKDVPEEHLQAVLDACVCAANASARQSYSIVVVRDRKVIREQLAYNGAVALLFCVDYNRIIDAASHLDKNFSQDGIFSFITGSTDTVLAAQTAAIAAKSLGIDSLFTNSIHRGDIQELYRFFNLPQRQCFPLIALILGYPESDPSNAKGRIKGKGIVHHERYERLEPAELDDLVSRYDRQEDHIGLVENWKEKDYPHYLDWFYTVWSGTTDDKKEEEIHLILQNAGFLKGI